MEKETLVFIGSLLSGIREFLTAAKTESNPKVFDRYGDTVYPTIHTAIYKHQILDTEDDDYVNGGDGSDNLLNLPLSNVAQAKAVSAMDNSEMQKNSSDSQREARIIYLIVEDLNAFFHQPLHFETIEEIREFAAPMLARLEEACDTILPRLLAAEDE